MTASRSPRGPYRRRTEREPQASIPLASALEDRDLAILAAVSDHRFLSRDLLLRLFPPDPLRTPTHAIRAAAARRALREGHEPRLPGIYVGSNLDRRLRKLFRAYLLDRIPLGVGAPLAYAVTARGVALLRKAGSLRNRPEGIGSANHLFYVRHALMVAEFRIALDLAATNHPTVEVAESQRESKALRRVWFVARDRYVVNPDGFLIIADQSRPEHPAARALFLECDRGTMTLERMLLKYENYARFERSGELRRTFDIPIARIVTVTETTAREAALLKLVAETESPLLDGMRDRFLFTSQAAYAACPDDVLAQIWRSAAKPTERNALIPSPLRRTGS